MLSFANDYQEGAHEKILQRLIETNLEPVSGYGTDPYCERAKEKIRTACECPEADILVSDRWNTDQPGGELTPCWPPMRA